MKKGSQIIKIRDAGGSKTTDDLINKSLYLANKHLLR